MAKSKYKAILFHPDGGCVTDFRDSNTIQEIWEAVADMGSKWIFYPIVLIATDNAPNVFTTIVDTPEGMEYFKGRKAKTVQKYLQTEWETRKDEICEFINAGLSMEWVYPDLPKTSN